MEAPFAIHSYQSRADQFSQQRCVNFYAESAPPDGKSPVVAFGAPGIAAFTTGLAGAVRGALTMDGVAYVVGGNTLYSISSTGTATSLGTLNTANGRVGMAANNASPKELGIVDGTNGYTYDTTNGLVQISDADFPNGANTIAFMDGYFVVDVPDGNSFQISDLNDGQTWIATDVGSAEGAPDDVKGVFATHRELWVYGEETTEVFYNSGASDFPFKTIQGAFIERGLGAAHAVATDNNTLYWLGDDGVIYTVQGFAPQRISTHAIEGQLDAYSDLSDAYAFIITISGHKFVHFVFPTGQAVFIYDIATGLWHERESNGARYWRAGAYCRAYNKHLIGDAFQGRVGTYSHDTYDEFGAQIDGSMTTPVIHIDRSKRLFFNNLELDIDSGVGTTTGAEPFLWLEWSNDGGRTWSLPKPARSLGKLGEYGKRVYWRQLGSARERVFRVSMSAAVKRAVIGAVVDAEPEDA